MITRQEAMDLLLSHRPESHLVNHAVQTEAIMAAMAGRLGQDAVLWGLTGLLHDLDYPLTRDTPSRHGLEAAVELAGLLPDEALRAIVAHNGERTGMAPESVFDYALRASEAVTGLISAAALIRPTGMEGLAPKSIKKKMKDKAFAAMVSREDILECAKAGLDLDEFLALAIAAMAGVAETTGLTRRVG